jgi:short-chain 2-methylacyl-CoA dehydrogenase
MEFDLSELQQSWRAKGKALGRGLPVNASASDVIAGAARAGLLEQHDLLAVAVAVESMACESAAAAIAFALHSGVVLGAVESVAAPQMSPLMTALLRGETVSAVGLSSDDFPTEENGRLSGRASWAAPLTDNGVIVVGARRRKSLGPASSVDEEVAPEERIACAAWLAEEGASFEPVETAGLGGMVCGHVTFADVPCTIVGETPPVMSRVRILLASAGLGMGRRALRESLGAARAYSHTGAGGEQTVQGLLADAATELDAAMLLTWKAASASRLSLAEASMAKLAATEATQRAVTRATQVIGGDSFRRGHIIERLSQDVRALELFAGRTEALREAVALETLPRPPMHR